MRQSYECFHFRFSSYHVIHHNKVTLENDPRILFFILYEEKRPSDISVL